jgi:2-dehydro-3-deoxyphosphooctonate aldolase (KDO 8-P synthase)
MEHKHISVGYGDLTPIKIGNGLPLVFIGGPCAIESRDHTLYMADQIKSICDSLDIPLIFKACYDKDCRSSPSSFHGLGIDEGLSVLEEVRSSLGVPVVSDFSDASWAQQTASVCDFIQVPAYLCRQTSILKAAANTGRPIHLKKGQFMSPWNMKNSTRKLEKFGATDILLTDRGTFFGYNMLVNDMTCLPIMKNTGYPVCFDATHSIQLPTSMGNISGGQRHFIPSLVRAAAACGINALFMEVHNDPPNALSDANTVLDLRYLKIILTQAQAIHNFRLELMNTLGPDNVHPEAG